MRYFAWIRFDGTAYHGWQIQPNGMSVQQRIEESLSLLLRQEVEVTGAGRTDAGVHARQLPCHFDLAETIDTSQLCFRLNRLLPNDISCDRIEEVTPDLHARFSAKSRTYRYFVHTAKDPFRRNYSVEMHWQLDFPLMNEAAAWLCEVEDFRAFCKAGADVKTTLCHVTRAQWVQTSDTSYYFEISANRFLRNMVRAVVGTLIEIGRHRITLERFRKIVKEGTRSDAGESMPAHGLFLWEVSY
ncbi:MAG: tRNA pseudouridine(38-40) synthase TruA [Prevotella sp.]|jgi:tRNA pseudouridine38-40 synthase